MSEQLAAFPPTPAERLAAMRSWVAEQYERAAAAADRAAEKRDEWAAKLELVDGIIAGDAVYRDDPVAQTAGSMSSLVPAVRVTFAESAVGTQRTITVPVFERTRFAALIYAACEQLGVVDVVDSEWTIVAAEDGSIVDPKHTVTADDHGREFFVVRQPQSRTKPCPACEGDGRLPDRTGGGHHRCKDCGGSGEVAA